MSALSPAVVTDQEARAIELVVTHWEYNAVPGELCRLWNVPDPPEYIGFPVACAFRCAAPHVVKAANLFRLHCDSSGAVWLYRSQRCVMCGGDLYPAILREAAR